MNSEVALENCGARKLKQRKHPSLVNPEFKFTALDPVIHKACRKCLPWTALR